LGISMQEIQKRAREIENEIITWRRELHAMPELKMETVCESKDIKTVN